MNRYHSEGDFRISQLLKDRHFDLIHLEGYYLMRLLPEGLYLPVVLIGHNIEDSFNLQRTILSRSCQNFLSNWREYYYTLSCERTIWETSYKGNDPYRRRRGDNKACRTQN